MTKLKFFHSAMNAGKSTYLLQRAFKYESFGWGVICGVPAIDNRFGQGKITSRIGLERDAFVIQNLVQENPIVEQIELNFMANIKSVVFIDEVQFMTSLEIKALQDIVFNYDVPVFTYGLKNNFRGELFSNSIQTLLAIADEIIEIDSLCFCGCKAKQNFRYDENFSKVMSGNTIELGAEDRYISVCNNHFYNYTRDTKDYLRKIHNEGI